MACNLPLGHSGSFHRANKPCAECDPPRFPAAGWAERACMTYMAELGLLAPARLAMEEVRFDTVNTYIIRSIDEAVAIPLIVAAFICWSSR